jgi:hypothetical protein
MIRARFNCNSDDPRPVTWPIRHPYWITGYGDDYAILVAYADDVDEILRNWPDAKNIESEQAASYSFSSRFPRPDWFIDAAPAEGKG